MIAAFARCNWRERSFLRTFASFGPGIIECKARSHCEWCKLKQIIGNMQGGVIGRR